MRGRVRLRFRLFLTILPLVVMVVLVSAVFASLESRAALTRIANRHMAFKAEQLRNYFFSEWKVMSDLGLSSDPAYQLAAEESFRSYAASLLRTRTELIIAFDGNGREVMNVAIGTGAGASAPQQGSGEPEKLEPGWFNKRLLGEDRVGVAFNLEPINWTVAVTELESAFFSDVRSIEYIHLWILIVSVAVVTVFLSVFIGYVVRPAERLTATIQHITVTNDLTQRAQVEFADEIGTLAGSFNTMISALQANYRKLEETSNAERIARQTAIEREEETLYLLGRVSDFRDMETGVHLKRIGALSALLSKLLGQSEEEQTLMRNSAPLHDIGKLAIPEAIIQKEGKLTAEEYEAMKLHASIGHELLKGARSIYLIEGAQIARTHHEKWDGSGYPSGLAGEEIPLSGRIVAIVDVFDALLSSRPYKKAWEPERVRDYIREQSGRHFDPALVDVFLENFDAFREYFISCEQTFKEQT
jgi:response regulator RpfG family c-di-GMP phosphodiesterase